MLEVIKRYFISLFYFKINFQQEQAGFRFIAVTVFRRECLSIRLIWVSGLLVLASNRTSDQPVTQAAYLKFIVPIDCLLFEHLIDFHLHYIYSF